LPKILVLSNLELHFRPLNLILDKPKNFGEITEKGE